ncbi:hypothetical protein BGX27_001271 [Mortierella sp. AM989]|nr:hypothetical protein BGX27_001271 [Mortierella sp. AM989]
MVAQTPQHRPFQDEAYQRRRNLNALVQMVFVCRALFDIVAPILWRHLDLMTTVETHSGYEQKRLKRWLEAILQQESWNNHAYPFSQVRSPEAIATMALYAHVPAARIGVGAFVKVLQMTRSLWLGLDKRSLEKMKMAFPCIAILQVLDVAELGGVDSQELHDFLGDPLSAISSYKDRLETDSRVLSHESQEAATEGQVSQLCLLFDSLASPQKSTAARTLESSRPMLTSQSSLLLQNMVQWFSRLESLVLPERGLAISDADIDMNEGVDINVDLRRKKRTISDVETLEPCSATGESRYIIDIESEQVNIKYGHKKRIELADQVETQATRQEAISSIHPRLLRSHSPHNNNMECPNRFMSLAHVSCSFEPIGLLSLDLILNQLSMPCLTSVEIRARSSLLNSVLAQSQKMSPKHCRSFTEASKE